MFFLLRCIFWLSIVYATMSWPDGTFQSSDPARSGGDRRAAVTATAASADRALLDGVITGARDLCTRRATECLAQSARLTGLVAAIGVVGKDHYPEKSIRTVATLDAAPRPIRDPRRLGH